MQNLTTRILTATTLGGGVVCGTLYLPFAVMSALFALILMGAAFEWSQLVGLVSRGGRLAYAVVSAAVAFASGLALHGHLAALNLVLTVACAWWCVALCWVVHYQLREGPRPRGRLLLMGCGWLVLIPALAAILELLQGRPELLLALFALVWGADTFAYFGGKTCGRRRLASRVSPGKTWEGLLAALVGTLALATVGARLLEPTPLAHVLALAVVTLLASVVGDLLESLLKRLRGVKDSGTLLPGHGGLLDRIDSLLAAAPVFTFGLILMERP